MRLYTIFHAMEMARVKYRIFEDKKYGEQYGRLRDDLIRRLERIELDNAILRGNIKEYDSMEEMIEDLDADD